MVSPGSGISSKSKERTLMLGLLTGAGACFISFFGFYFGKTTVQLIDFIKRMNELSSVLAACFISIRYRDDREKLQKAELVSSRIVSLILLISAILLVLVMILKQHSSPVHGNVLIGICISCGDITMNSFFLIRYYILGKHMESKLVVAQKNFYFMKVLSNFTVLASLLLLFVIASHRFDRMIDTGASCVLIFISITVSVRNFIRTCYSASR